jgi:ABC-type spermidine/putrescine transport system permease subunit II
MRRIVVLLLLAAVVGVVGATAVTCGVGLASGTSTWCGLPLYWVVGIPPAAISAVVLGLPAYLLFRKLGFLRWWQFIIGGTVLALPFWYEFAQPFSSARWHASGFFDSLNYLGSGAVAGFAFWWSAVRSRGTNAL